MVVTALVFVFVFSVKAAIFRCTCGCPQPTRYRPPHQRHPRGRARQGGHLLDHPLRHAHLPAAFLILQPGLIALCLLTIDMGALGTLPQTSIKRILAYSTINQLGYIAFGVACSRKRASQRRSSTSSATPI